ncbi:potassium channel beta subunit family protein [Brumicola pallidula]|uniref:Potassium voltage-gated channel Shaker-related subfamily A, beta member 2 n=1 Tax=Brumicola pallidula DSM 14239 = ACAM 615 TaxID=1121922 RepID=K7A2I0_9ALTE|nr:aldo/keto reductase [Glaciecola pallidula]GAC29705.1 potassium voltage-gated channel Shaker-related subfamily A, beta member 2 [Glaciecola pallidula DSM 14239 = ACAM 615]
MEYRRLGKAGLKVSALSLGSWVTFGKQVDMNDAKSLLKTAYDGGINFFDNAEGYEAGESERIMGDAIAGLGLARDTFAVSSKVFWGGDKQMQLGLSAKHVRDACDAALKRLRVDYLDLYFCHRPDIDTPIEETVRAMHNLVQQGKVIYWGTSEWSSQQITQAHAIAKQEHLTAPTMEQPQYNLLHRDKVDGEFNTLYEEFGMGTTIWSPLASGLLTGKYNDGIPDDSRLALPGYEWLRDLWTSEDGKKKLEKIRQLSILSKELDISMTHLSIAWCLKNPNVSTVILGASRLSQLTDNLGAMNAVAKLTPEVIARIETIVANKPAAAERFGQ